MEALCFVTNVTQNDGGVSVKYFNWVLVLKLSAEHGGHIGCNYCSCKFTTWSRHWLQGCDSSLTHQETDMYLIRVVLKAEVGYLAKAHFTGIRETVHLGYNWLTKTGGLDTSCDRNFFPGGGVPTPISPPVSERGLVRDHPIRCRHGIVLEVAVFPLR